MIYTITLIDPAAGGLYRRPCLAEATDQQERARSTPRESRNGRVAEER